MPEEKPKEAAPKPPAEEKAKQEKKERPKECSSCGKNIEKNWYYREGNYYCGKNCWKKAKKEAGEKAAREEQK
jgi:hypothetical protein